MFTKQKWKKEKQSFITKYGKRGTQLGNRYVNCKLQPLRKNQQLGAQQKQQRGRKETREESNLELPKAERKVERKSSPSQV